MRSRGFCTGGKCRNLLTICKSLCEECKERKQTYLNEYRAKNRDKTNEYARRHAPPYSPRRREVNSSIKTKFGLSKTEVNTMLASQGYVCAICHQPNNLKSRMGLDHNHETGQYREFLCHRCNSVLGFVNEDVSILSNMVRYIRKHGGN